VSLNNREHCGELNEFLPSCRESNRPIFPVGREAERVGDAPVDSETSNLRPQPVSFRSPQI